MAYKGSHIVPVRVPAELQAALDEVIARSVDSRPEGPWTRSSFIIKAIQDKLRHMARAAGRDTKSVPTVFARDQF
jgi:metal-responsive CopG/Arc/MetJ family transcriptional regulator